MEKKDEEKKGPVYSWSPQWLKRHFVVFFFSLKFK